LYQETAATDDMDVEIIKLDDDIIEQLGVEVSDYGGSQPVMMGLWRVGYLSRR
jgi:spore cortex formation protein SpoVR/YcgB (stage V sporulation)